MTEKEVILLGFNKELMEGGEYYYSYRITTGLDFISCTDKDAQELGQWRVEVFNTDCPIRFYDFAKLQALLNTLESAKDEKKSKD